MSEEMKGLIDLGWFGELPKEGVCPRCDGDGMVPADPEIEPGEHDWIELRHTEKAPDVVQP